MQPSWVSYELLYFFSFSRTLAVVSSLNLKSGHGGCIGNRTRNRDFARSRAEPSVQPYLADGEGFEPSGLIARQF